MTTMLVIFVMSLAGALVLTSPGGIRAVRGGNAQIRRSSSQQSGSTVAS